MRRETRWHPETGLNRSRLLHEDSEGIMSKLSVSAISRRLAGLKGWKQVGHAIQKQYTFPDFKAAMFFVNVVAGIAEKAGHHPDITVNYNRVTLRLSTHDAGGITAKDFDLASRIEAAT
jgi:4a-hydroxytetrahydrobiopterin dehydratase